jgi:hypothetical protein
MALQANWLNVDVGDGWFRSTVSGHDNGACKCQSHGSRHVKSLSPTYRGQLDLDYQYCLELGIVPLLRGGEELNEGNSQQSGAGGDSHTCSLTNRLGSFVLRQPRGQAIPRSSDR